MKGMHGIIFSYGEKPALGRLTANRIHGSLPFGGDYRVVDFALSNMVNAGITDVDVVGLAESHCVACTAVDAVHAGFPTRVLRELTAPVTEELGASARQWMTSEGVLLV